MDRMLTPEKQEALAAGAGHALRAEAHRYASRQDDHAKAARWWPYVARIDREERPNRGAAYTAEFAAIRAERPIFNRLRGRMIPWQQEREQCYVEMRRRGLSWSDINRLTGVHVA